MTQPSPRIDSDSFYSNYFGHQLDELEVLYEALVARPRREYLEQQKRPQGSADSAGPVSTIFLVGDSSMDNKHWLLSSERRVAATNGYETVLKPARSVPDVAYQVNSLLSRIYKDEVSSVFPELQLGPQSAGNPAPPRYVCINCAFEESTLEDRKTDELPPHDCFVRDHLTPDDILIISVGGNDIALKPTGSTIAAMGWLTMCSKKKNILDGSAWGLGRFETLLETRLQKFTNALTSKCKPRMVIPAMIYYPDERPEPGAWSNRVLKLIGYDKDPGHVQALIDYVFKAYMCQLRVPGSLVRPVAMSTVMNGKTKEDYVERVEPSAKGGAKIAQLFLRTIAQEPGLLI
jgi:hypothetical protein